MESGRLRLLARCLLRITGVQMLKRSLYNLGLLAALLLITGSSSAHALGMRAARFDPPVPTAPNLVCRHYAAEAEKAHRIPRELMRAISLTESGRWDRKTRRHDPWPWTVTSGKRHWYLASKQAAIAQVEKLVREGVRNIDVGCMQINLHFHPKAFATLAMAFDPASNADYAARYLKGLRDKTKSWRLAVARYHSATPEFGSRYRAKVYKFLRNERHLAATERREAAKARYRRWRAEKDAERARRLGQNTVRTYASATN